MTDAVEKRRREAKAASLALQGAAWILVLRGTILPVLIARTQAPRYDADGYLLPPVASPFGDADPDQVRLSSYAAAAVFVGLCVWARKKPLPAAVAGLILYAGFCLPDLANGAGLIEKGVVGKLITFLAIARALVAGIMHNLTPVPQATAGQRLSPAT